MTEQHNRWDTRVCIRCQSHELKCAILLWQRRSVHHLKFTVIKKTISWSTEGSCSCWVDKYGFCVGEKVTLLLWANCGQFLLFFLVISSWQFVNMNLLSYIHLTACKMMMCIWGKPGSHSATVLQFECLRQKIGVTVDAFMRDFRTLHRSFTREREWFVDEEHQFCKETSNTSLAGTDRVNLHKPNKELDKNTVCTLIQQRLYTQSHSECVREEKLEEATVLSLR